MANVVLCSELGQGKRYLAKLADCAAELRSQRHTVRLVCSDLTTAHSMKAFKKLSIFQAPVYRPVDRRKKKRRLLNYSSVLLANGYATADSLTPLLRAWLHLLATLDADIVMTDHAPTPLLAAKLLMIPSVMMGSGYTVPPRANPLPSLSPWKSASAEEGSVDSVLVAEDSALLASVNQALKNLNFDEVELKKVQEIYTHADQWVMSLAEIDHYGSRDADYVVRWADAGTAYQEPVWPSQSGDKVFVYLEANSPHLQPLLEQLRVHGKPTLAVVNGVADDVIEHYAGSNIIVQREPVDIRSASKQCRIFISHCGHDLVYELLMLGVPPILLPNNPENTLLAYRVAKHKLGFAGPSQPDKLNINQLIEKVNDSDQIWANASRISLKYQDRDALARIHDLISAKLPRAV